MKTIFFVCLGLLIGVLALLAFLSSAIDNLKLEIMREENLEKRKAFQRARKRTARETTPVPTFHNELEEPETPKIPEDYRRPTMELIHTTVVSHQPPLSIGKAHNIGRRGAQQDSLGAMPLFQGNGLLAIVADGMGGLTGGDEVSQRIVMQALSLAPAIRPDNMDLALSSMLNVINQDVNNMLGPDRLYKSGSTLTAVLATPKCFHWLTVGDSRIYLYREGYINQLNRDHDLLQDWMPDILEGYRNYEEASKDNEGKKLTSFIGMGSLKYVDKSLRAINTRPGDRVLLMSDGVYNAISTHQMANILKQYPDVQTAADMFERAVLAARIPTQDNFTVEIIAF